MTASHDATASAVGYLYQAQWGLLEVIRAAADRPDQLMSFERLDDIAWERDTSNPERLLQMKHHEAGGFVSDKSPDVWRTLRVWMDRMDVGEQDAELYLVTTQTAADESALSLLRPSSERDVGRATRLLLEAATDSKSKTTESARGKFRLLDENRRTALVSRISVLDAAPLAGDVFVRVREELFLVLPASHEEIFLSSLWGWWYSVVLDMLQGRREGIRPSQARSRISDLRDEFTRGALPTLIPNISGTSQESEIAEQYDDRPFVHQMRWVETPDRVLARAIVDYYRAVTQAQLWVEDNLIGIHELEEFERNLVDEWQREMDWRLDELPREATEEQKAQVGKSLLRAILDQTKVRVRERYDEAFFSRGMYHELADIGRVGWHPDFEARLQDIFARAAS